MILPRAAMLRYVMPGAERAEARRGRAAGEIAERCVRLEHVLPLAPDLGDLQVVVHHPDRGEPGLFCLAGDRGQLLGDAGAPTRPRESRKLQSERERHRILLLPVGSDWCIDELGWDEDDVVLRCGDDCVEPLSGDVSQRRAEVAQLGSQRRRRDAVGALAVAPPHLTLRDVEDRGDDGDSVSARCLDVRRDAAQPPGRSSRPRSSAAAADGDRRRDRALRTPPYRRAGPSRSCRPLPAGGPRRSPVRAGTSAPPTSICRTLPVRRSPRGRGRGVGSPRPCPAHGARSYRWAEIGTDHDRRINDGCDGPFVGWVPRGREPRQQRAAARHRW